LPLAQLWYLLLSITVTSLLEICTIWPLTPGWEPAQVIAAFKKTLPEPNLLPA